MNKQGRQTVEMPDSNLMFKVGSADLDFELRSPNSGLEPRMDHSHQD